MENLTDQRFAEIAKDKEICEFCEDCENDEVCINCKRVKPATAHELRAFWTKVSRATELVKAYKEGLVLPCKPPRVGDAIYEPVKGHGVIHNKVTFSDGLTFEARSGKSGYIRFGIMEIGKTVFLTRAEAEAALGGGGDG